MPHYGATNCLPTFQISVGREYKAEGARFICAETASNRVEPKSNRAKLKFNRAEPSISCAISLDFHAFRFRECAIKICECAVLLWGALAVCCFLRQEGRWAVPMEWGLLYAEDVVVAVSLGVTVHRWLLLQK